MNAQQVIGDLTAQVDWYGKLLRLAELQHRLVEEERFDDLLVVLEKRKLIVEQLTAIEGRLKPLKLRWSEVAPLLAPADRAAIEARFAQVRDLLGQITQADSDDTLLLTQRKINVAQQLRHTTAGRQMNQRYAASSYAGAGGQMNVSH